MTVNQLIALLRVHKERFSSGGDTPVVVRLEQGPAQVLDCHLDLNLKAVALVLELPAAGKPCPGCGGDGRWQTECCSGASGCSCRGDVVEMGTCNVCKGRGIVYEGLYDPKANIKAIEGRMYIGSGPTR